MTNEKSRTETASLVGDSAMPVTLTWSGLAVMDSLPLRSVQTPQRDVSDTGRLLLT